MSDQSVSISQRLRVLPDYPFVRINRLKAERTAKGLPLYDFGIGAPDMPTPEPIIAEFTRHLGRLENQVYSGVAGKQVLLSSIGRYMSGRFNLDYEKLGLDALPLSGSKEGLAKAPLAFVNPGDTILLPDPGYPVYSVAHLWCEAQSAHIPLDPATARMSPAALAKKVQDVESGGGRVALLYLNYPNNPTGAGISRPELEEIVRICRKWGITLFYDNAYAEVYDPGATPPDSIFQIPGAEKCAVEFHSLSKTFLMTGWRLGFAVAHRDLLGPIRRLKSNFDSGVFAPLQLAGAFALDNLTSFAEPTRVEFAKRRKIAAQALDAMGLNYIKSPFTFYMWIGIPNNTPAETFTEQALVDHGLVLTPGTAFGPSGEGWFRISLCLGEEQLSSALGILKDCIDLG